MGFGAPRPKYAKAERGDLHHPSEAPPRADGARNLELFPPFQAAFFGFKKQKIRAGIEAWVAEPEKALLDWVYLRRRAGEPVALDEIDWHLLRPAVLKSYLKAFPAWTGRLVKKP